MTTTFEQTLKVTLNDIADLNKYLFSLKSLTEENKILKKICYKQHWLIKLFQEKFINNQAKMN